MINENYNMKKLIIVIMLILLIVPVCFAEPTAVFPSADGDSEFCGCIKRLSVDEPFTVGWDHIDGAEGCELKIIHYFYEGLETKVVETSGTTYTFNNLPKSSRHFEVKARSFNTRSDGTREYSIWVSSTDKNYSVYNGKACGWLIYTVHSVPSW